MKIDIQFNSEGFRQILVGDGVKNVVEEATKNIAEKANANLTEVLMSRKLSELR